MTDNNDKTIFLIKDASLKDSGFPFVYSGLREELNKTEEKLYPNLRYVHLYVNRKLVGLYLRVDIPNQVGSEEVNWLQVNGPKVRCIGNELESPCPYLSDMMMEGKFPQITSDSRFGKFQSLNQKMVTPKFFLISKGGIAYPFPLPFDPFELLSSIKLGEEVPYLVSDDRVSNLLEGGNLEGNISLETLRKNIESYIKQREFSQFVTGLKGISRSQSEILDSNSIKWASDAL